MWIVIVRLFQACKDERYSSKESSSSSHTYPILHIAPMMEKMRTRIKCELHRRSMPPLPSLKNSNVTRLPKIALLKILMHCCWSDIPTYYPSWTLPVEKNFGVAHRSLCFRIWIVCYMLSYCKKLRDSSIRPSH